MHLLLKGICTSYELHSIASKIDPPITWLKPAFDSCFYTYLYYKQ